MIQKKQLNMAIEIVDLYHLPINSMVIFQFVM